VSFARWVRFPNCGGIFFLPFSLPTSVSNSQIATRRFAHGMSVFFPTAMFKDDFRRTLAARYLGDFFSGNQSTVTTGRNREHGRHEPSPGLGRVRRL
jgi:hypothetical protein